MSDLFHKDVPFEYIQEVFAVMNTVTHHTYQVLTKRAERLAELSSQLKWTPNIWMGVSVESADYVQRAKLLATTSAHIKFLSVEPLLGAIPELPLQGIDWVIVGGESGHRARPIQEDWIVDIREQCDRQGTRFFFKQWGGRNKKANGRILQGRTWDDMPES